MNLSESYEKKKEMQKFILYYFIKEELDNLDNKDIAKIIEFESIYGDRINIRTLDKFSCNNVKTIKKE